MTLRTFDANSHQRFSELSQDYNPLHTDSIVSHRTQVRAPTIHGIHSLLWLLETISQNAAVLPRATNLKVGFKAPIYVGDTGRADMMERTAKRVRARILVSGAEAVMASIGFGDRKEAYRPGAHALATSMVRPLSPINLRLDEMPGRSGYLPVSCTATEAESMFPSTVRYLGVQQVLALISASFLVGMVVPGFHALFVGLDVAIAAEDSTWANTLYFEVRSVDERLRLVQIDINGGSLFGSLEALVRPPAVV
jgi:acyl dehydratase